MERSIHEIIDKAENNIRVIFIKKKKHLACRHTDVNHSPRLSSFGTKDIMFEREPNPSAFTEQVLGTYRLLGL